MWYFLVFACIWNKYFNLICASFGIISQFCIFSAHVLGIRLRLVSVLFFMLFHICLFLGNFWTVFTLELWWKSFLDNDLKCVGTSCYLHYRLPTDTIGNIAKKTKKTNVIVFFLYCLFRVNMKMEYVLTSWVFISEDF